MDKQQIIKQIENYCNENFKFFLIIDHRILSIETLNDIKKLNSFFSLEINFNRPNKGYENLYDYDWSIRFLDKPGYIYKTIPCIALNEAKKEAEKIFIENEEWIEDNLEFIKNMKLNTLEDRNSRIKKEMIQRAKNAVENLTNSLREAKKELNFLLDEK